MDDDMDEKIAVAATFGMSAVFGKASPRCSPSKMRQHVAASKTTSSSTLVTSDAPFQSYTNSDTFCKTNLCQL